MLSISGTIATGGVAQTLFDNQKQSFKGFWLQNDSASSSMFINENGTATATQPSLEIKPGELYETPPNAPLFLEPISIYCATTAASFSARVW